MTGWRRTAPGRAATRVARTLRWTARAQRRGLASTRRVWPAMTRAAARRGTVWPEPAPRPRTDLGEVVGEDAVSAPGAGAGEPVEEGAVPAGAAFEVGDAAFAAALPVGRPPGATTLRRVPAGRCSRRRSRSGS